MKTLTNKTSPRHGARRMIPWSAALFLFFLMLAGGARAQDVQFDFNSADAATQAIQAAQDSALPFPGGVLIGDVFPKETEAGETLYAITGPAGIILPPGHAGGVLRLEFAIAPEQPAEMILHQFPRELTPHNIVFDGRLVEIQIAPEQEYQFIQPADPDASITLLLSAVAFEQNAALSDQAACDCLQVALHNADGITADALDALISSAP